jgi:hypothetical protein
MEKCQKNSKKLLTEAFQSGIIVIPLRVGFFVVQQEAPLPKGTAARHSVREVHGPLL